jgi:tetratricopeptide (TPR) repeat protein
MTTAFAFVVKPVARATLIACLGLAAAWPLSAQPDDSAEVQRLMREKQYPQALKAIDDYLAKKPDDPKMRFRRGVVLSNLDRSAEALKVFQKLAEDHPDMPAPHNNVAVLLAARGDYERARAALEAAIRTNPAYATAYQNLGDVYARLASQAYTKALQLDKTDTTLAPKLALLRELTTSSESGTTLAAAPAPAAPANATPTLPVAKPTAAPAAPASAVAVAKAPSAAPSAAPAAAPAAPPPASPPAAAAAHGTAEVTKAVQAWAQAWSRRDMEAYYAAYAPGFAPPGKTHKSWREDRRLRIEPRSRIKVELVDLRVTIDGDKATARFRQIYESDTLSTSGLKTLELARDNGRWVIRQESAGQ